MRTLYQISEDLTALEDILTQGDGEISDDEAGLALEAWFDALGEERDAKIDNYCALIAELTTKASAREVEGNRLMALATTDANAAKRLRDRLKLFLDAHGMTKLETNRFKLTVAKNGGASPLLIPDEWTSDPSSAPEQFHRRIVQLDKNAIRTAIEDGQDIPGVAIGERGTHLRIR